jgi:hypothetical protein
MVPNAVEKGKAMRKIIGSFSGKDNARVYVHSFHAHAGDRRYSITLYGVALRIGAKHYAILWPGCQAWYPHTRIGRFLSRLVAKLG